MSVNQIITPFALAAAVAPAGTVVVAYPSLPVSSLSDTAKNAPNDNLGSGNFQLSDGKHTLKIGNNIYNAPKDFTLSFGNVSAGITITNKTLGTWPAGAVAALGLDLNGALSNSSIPLMSTRVVPTREILFDLGSPVALSLVGVAAAQLKAAAGDLTLVQTAGLPGGGFQMDTPRNVTLTVATTDQSARTFTIYGFDEFGQAMVESMAGPNANTVQGKKAFARVTRVAVDGVIATNGVSVGYGNALGLPLAVRKAGQITKEIQDGANASAGTFAYALQNAVSTATTADVRGTYIPASAPDGAKGYLIGALITDGTDIGPSQFTA